MDGFIRSLQRRQAESLSTLVSAYAQEDAAAAFRLAEISHLSLAEAFPEIVIVHCDQEPFFALVVEQALSEPQSRIRSWASLLAAAGLRSQVVAGRLLGNPPASEWNATLAAIPKEKRWHVKRLLKLNFYTQCLTLAAHDQTIAADPLLSAFREIPPPGRFGYGKKLWISIGILCAVFSTQIFLMSHRQLYNFDYRHFRAIWAILLTFQLFGSLLVYVPVLNICANLYSYREIIYGMNKSFRKLLPKYLRPTRLVLLLTRSGRELYRATKKFVTLRKQIRPS